MATDSKASVVAALSAANFLIFLPVDYTVIQYSIGDTKDVSSSGIVSWLDACREQTQAERVSVMYQQGPGGQFGKLLYCAALLPGVEIVMDVFLDKGESAQCLTEALLRKSRLLAGFTPSVVGFEKDTEKLKMARETLVAMIETQDSSAVLQLELDAGWPLELVRSDLAESCTRDSCKRTRVVPSQGPLLSYCMELFSQGRELHLAVFNGNPWVGVEELKEWSVVRDWCRPVMVAMYGVNVHPAYEAMVQELVNTPGWSVLNSGSVQVSDPRFKWRKFVLMGQPWRLEYMLLQSYPQADRKAILTTDTYTLPVSWNHKEDTAVGPGLVAFDMLLIMPVPNCVAYATVESALTYLKPQGLRKIWIVTHQRWLQDVTAWGNRVEAVDFEKTLTAVRFSAVYELMESFDKFRFDATPEQKEEIVTQVMLELITIGFVLRDDVLDILLVHEANQVILKGFKVFAEGKFKDPRRPNEDHDGDIPRFHWRRGGENIEFKYRQMSDCLTGRPLYEAEVRDLSFYSSKSFIAFKPFVREALESFGKEVRSLAWVNNLVKCFDKDNPGLGIAGWQSYISSMIHFHENAIAVAEQKTWASSPLVPGPLWQPGGFCCVSQDALVPHHRLHHEFVRFDLGSEDWHGKCMLRNGDAVSLFFKEHPYPPASHAYWIDRGVKFRHADVGSS